MGKWGPNIRQILQNPEAMKFVDQLTKPSLSYSGIITKLVGWKPNGLLGEPMVKIHGAAHITGGGVWGKLADILPPGVGVELPEMPEPPAVLLEAQKLSARLQNPLNDFRAYGDLHGGCGMFVICNPEDADTVIAEVSRQGKVAKKVGVTTESENSEIRIKSRFMEGRWLSSLESSSAS